MRERVDRFNFTEETNALDYLERCIGFLREVEAGTTSSWKWVAIAAHGALYGFAVSAARGTNWHQVTYVNKKGTRRLLSLDEILMLCEDPRHMGMLGHSKALVLTDAERKAIDNLSKDIRNAFEHYIPQAWVIFAEGLPLRTFLVLKVTKFLAVQTETFVHLTDEEQAKIVDLVQEGYDICSRVRVTYKTP